MSTFNVLSDVYFFTCTNLNWKPALEKDHRKQFFIDSMKFLTETKRVRIFGFVIMPNHVHILWKDMTPDHKNKKIFIQGSLLKHTSKQILSDMSEDEKSSYLVNAKDRKYQIWERNPLWVDTFNMKIAEQKLTYIHHNPCEGRWKLCPHPANYIYSSASFYETGDDRFGFLSNLYDL